MNEREIFDAALAISQNRHTDEASLGKTIRGDLDWIVMKALEKDRSRRYETPNCLAADLNRHLTNDVIEARPPSVYYQIQKFYHRNRTLASSVAEVDAELAWDLALQAVDEARFFANSVEEPSLAAATPVLACHVACLLRNGDVGRAKEVLRHDPVDDWASLNKCLVALFESDYQRVSDLSGELIDRKESEPWTRLMALALFLLSGATDTATSTADQWLASDFPESMVFEQRIWDFLLNSQIEPEEMFDAASESRRKQCLAHFYVGVRFLAGGQVDKAKDHLRKMDESPVFLRSEVAWARVLLHKINSSK